MVRRYCPKDRKSVQNICIETAPSEMKDSDRKRNFLLLRYCNYYTEKCPDTCFVAEKDGNVAGYVICCPDAVRFKREFTEFVKANGNLSLLQRLQCFGDTLMYLPFKKKYPAHLHIDILPEAQKQGNGKKLIEALTNELKIQGISGVMLAVAASNANAVRFYRALGFKALFHITGTYFLGKHI